MAVIEALDPQQQLTSVPLAKGVKAHNLGMLGGGFGPIGLAIAGAGRLILGLGGTIAMIRTFKPQAELDRRVNKGADRIEGDAQVFRAIAEIEDDRKPIIIDGETIIPILDDDGHLFGIAVAQPIGQAHPRRAGVEGDEKMMLTG